MPTRSIHLGPSAVAQFKTLSARRRSLLKSAMEASLAQDDAAVENHNRFRLRRPSGQFEFELRANELRVFYRVKGNRVLVDAIGIKRGNQLFIGNQKVTI